MSRAALVLLAVAVGCASPRPAAPVATEPLIEKPVADSNATEGPARFECDEADVDWPMFQRNVQRVGTTEAPPIASPRVAWSNRVGISGWLNSPLIADGRVFAPSSGQVWNRPDGADGVYAFDLASGEQQWFVSTADDANGAAYHRCRVFTTSDAGTVTAVHAQTGKTLWVTELAGKIYANPLVIDGLVIVGGERGELAALDSSTGEPVWKRHVGGPVRGGASADDERVFVTTETGHVVALRYKDGQPQWSVRIDGAKSAYGLPTVAGGKIFVGFVRDTSYNTPAVAAYDAATGTELWRARNSRDLSGGWGNVRSSPALVDGHLYWGEPYSNRIVALDVLGGDVATSTPAGVCTFPHWPSPAVAQDIVYLPRHDGGLYAVNATDGSLAWSFYLGDAKSVSQTFPPEHQAPGADRCQWEPPFGRPIYASPAVASDGTVIVGTGDGWLHAIREDSQ